MKKRSVVINLIFSLLNIYIFPSIEQIEKNIVILDSWINNIPHRTDQIQPTSRSIVALCRIAAKRLYKHATMFFS